MYNRYTNESTIIERLQSFFPVTVTILLIFAMFSIFLYRKVFKTPGPPDVQELGRASWTFLHSVAATFPENPNEMDRKDMNDFLYKVARFYPCSKCSTHMLEQLQLHKPNLQDRASLQAYFCWLHNTVNNKLGKPTFDCSQIRKRWGGYGNGEHKFCKSM